VEGEMSTVSGPVATACCWHATYLEQQLASARQQRQQEATQPIAVAEYRREA